MLSAARPRRGVPGYRHRTGQPANRASRFRRRSPRGEHKLSTRSGRRPSAYEIHGEGERIRRGSQGRAMNAGLSFGLQTPRTIPRPFNLSRSSNRKTMKACNLNRRTARWCCCCTCCCCTRCWPPARLPPTPDGQRPSFATRTWISTGMTTGHASCRRAGP